VNFTRILGNSDFLKGTSQGSSSLGEGKLSHTVICLKLWHWPTHRKAVCTGGCVDQCVRFWTNIGECFKMQKLLRSGNPSKISSALLFSSRLFLSKVSPLLGLLPRHFLTSSLAFACWASVAFPLLDYKHFTWNCSTSFRVWCRRAAACLIIKTLSESLSFYYN
jgi:hypothetical protein